MTAQTAAAVERIERHACPSYLLPLLQDHCEELKVRRVVTDYTWQLVQSRNGLVELLTTSPEGNSYLIALHRGERTCTCPAWLASGATMQERHCKHLIAVGYLDNLASLPQAPMSVVNRIRRAVAMRTAPPINAAEYERRKAEAERTVARARAMAAERNAAKNGGPALGSAEEAANW